MKATATKLWDSKYCSKCHKVKLISDFSKNSRAKDGLSYWCKDCNKEYQEQRKEANKIKYKTCSQCGETKELNPDNFHRNKNSKDGYKWECKECSTKRANALRAKNEAKMEKPRTFIQKLKYLFS